MTKKFKICLVADVFPPHNTSAAVQLGDLCREFIQQGFHVTVLVPGMAQSNAWVVEQWEGVELIKLKSWKIKNVSFIRRFVGEILLPFFMIRNFKKCPQIHELWDGIIWYSPTIFLGRVAHFLRKKSGAKAYLIIRDIFPDWAVNLGVLKKGPAYYFLKSVESYQYKVADVIGVETPSNLNYFNKWSNGARKIEVLENWISDLPNTPCSIDISQTKLAGKKICIYAGTLGIAQNVYKIITLADFMRGEDDIGFVVVGQGSEAKRIRNHAEELGLENILFFDSIPADEILTLYIQCDVGLLTLDHRHKTFNVPGKFVSYMQAGLPILASINPGSDLVDLINNHNVGKVSVSENLREMIPMITDLMEMIEKDRELENRCIALAMEHYRPSTAVKKIVNGLELS